MYGGIIKGKALKYFHGEDGYNCAQAIYAAFCQFCSKADVEKFRSMGGGRAEGGVCGAAYAALKLLPDDEKREQFKAEFSEKAGSLKCREILKSRTFKCKQCVELAADFLEKNREK